ncbi:hypothetical protein C8J57DRAFT_1479337 [Mycena rebaudengoi]|nr:hypothetical protein C8J57DRAFT_1479337 [Mycena rebaudengoi]
MSSSLLDTSDPLKLLMHTDDDEIRALVRPFQFTFESSPSSSSESASAYSPQDSCKGDLLEVSDSALELASHVRKSAGVHNLQPPQAQGHCYYRGGRREEEARPPTQGRAPPRNVTRARPRTVDDDAYGLRAVHARRRSGAHQYLLSAFALFSFFANSSSVSRTYSAPHTHEGHVLTPLVPHEKTATGGASWLQLFRLLVSAALLSPAIDKSHVLEKPTALALEKPTALHTHEDNDTDDALLSAYEEEREHEGGEDDALLAQAEQCICDAKTRATATACASSRCSCAPSRSSGARVPHDCGLPLPPPLPLPFLAASLTGPVPEMEMEMEMDVHEAAARALDRLRGVGARAFVREVFAASRVGSEHRREGCATGVGTRTRRLARGARARAGRARGCARGAGGYDNGEEGRDAEDDAVEALLRVVVLYRRVFWGREGVKK